MNNKLYKYLCCPKCKISFKKKTDSLFCNKCSTNFRIRNGIPILINYKRLSPHLRQQIKYFELEKATLTNKYTLEIWQKFYINRFLKSAKEKSLIYDCGSGSGYMAIELAKHGYKVIVSDLTFKSVLRIKKISENLGISKNMLFICSLAEELPIKENSVSELISHAVLEHLTNEKQAISEWKTVLKPNGHMFVTVPLKFRYVFPLLWIPNYVHDKRIGHLRRYDKRTLMTKFDIPIIKTYYTGHIIKIIGIVASILGFVKENNTYFENEDARQSNKLFWANNISVVFKNKK